MYFILCEKVFLLLYIPGLLVGISASLAHRQGLFHGFRLFDFADLPSSHAIDYSFFFCLFQTIGKAPEAFDGAFHGGDARVGSCHDKVEFLVTDFGVTGTCPVYQGFHLGIHRVEIDGSGHYDDIRGDHLFQNFGHVILLRARLSRVTDAASRAIMNRPVF